MKEDYIVYEYISIHVKNELEPVYIDCYKNFGWIHIKDNEKRDYYINSNSNPNTVEIKFKRDRNINNKEKLQELQKNCEKAFLEVHKLEKMPQLLATIYSLSIGVIAIVFIVISVFSMINYIWFLAILSSVIGLIACIFPYFIYKNVKHKKEIENKDKIEKQQNIIYDIYKQVGKILLENEEN